MIRPDGSERVLHVGKNEVNSRELDFLSNNSLILFEIYFSPTLKPYLRFYGYTPLRLNLEKIDGNSKHIYIDNNQSFVILEQLENTTIDVYDKDEFVTFSFQKNIKKPENSKDIIEKNKRIKWLNENIEYEDLKKEENEYGNKSLYSKDYFNYSKKNLKKDEEPINKSEDIMSNFSKDVIESINKAEEKSKEQINKEKEKEESIHDKTDEEREESEFQQKSEKSEDINNLKRKEEISETLEKNSNEKSKSISKSISFGENENIKDNKSSSKKLSSSGAIIEKESRKSKHSSEKEIILDKKSKSLKSDKSPIQNSKSEEMEEEENEEIEEEEKKEEQNSEEKNKSKLLNYDKILDNFVLFNSDSESKEDSSENEEEEFIEKKDNIDLKNLNLKKENSLTKKDKLSTSLQTKCTICLDQMNDPATLKPCGHQFCKECISKWLQKSSACPDCKKNGKKLYFFSSKNGRFMAKRIKRKKYKAEKQNYEDWFLNCDKTCLICGKEDNTAYLLVCDSCNFRICHTFCVGLDSIPDTEWHCPESQA